MCKAILTPFPEPDLKVCKFVYEKKKYSAKLTPDQCQTILKAVNDKRNVPELVSLLLGGFTKQVAGWIEALTTALDVPAKARKKPPTVSSNKPVTLGCCIYVGGMTPNLSQAQCNQYNPTSWDSSDPDCTDRKPPD